MGLKIGLEMRALLYRVLLNKYGVNNEGWTQGRESSTWGKDIRYIKEWGGKCLNEYPVKETYKSLTMNYQSHFNYTRSKV